MVIAVESKEQAFGRCRLEVVPKIDAEHLGKFLHEHIAPGSVAPLRALNVTRRSAVKAQQAARRQIDSLLVNAPAAVRDCYRDRPDAKLLAALASLQPEQYADPGITDTMHSLRSLAP